MDYTKFNRVFYLSQAVGLLAIVLTFLWIIIFRHGFTWGYNFGVEFNWHPFLMTIGPVVLQADAILTFRAFRDSKKNSLKILHGAFHIGAIILTIIGLIPAMDLHNYGAAPRAHLYTLHSWVGVIAIILYIIQWILGLVTYLKPGLSVQFKTSLMPYHTFIGHIILGISVGTAVIGLNTKAIYTLGTIYSTHSWEGTLINVIGVLLVLFECLILYVSTNPRYKRHQRPEDTPLLTSATD